MTSKPKVRIVLLTTSYPQSAGDPAGHFVETEANNLALDGHEVHVIAPGFNRPGPNASTPSRGGCHPLTAAGVTVWGAGGTSLFGFPGILARARENPFRLLQLGDFFSGVTRRLTALAPIDRIVAHFMVPCGFPLALGAAAEIEVVLHGTDVSVVSSLPTFVRAYVVERLLARDARFRFVSESLRKRLLDALPSTLRAGVEVRSRVEASPIAVERASDAVVRRCRSILGRDDQSRWVACARLVASKRIDLAIREATLSGAQLTVIGDGPLRGSLEKLAAASQPRARFLGQLPRHEALAFIAAADRLIHTSQSEGAPTVIREARALGIPVLATPTGDVAEWAQTDPGIELLPTS